MQPLAELQGHQTEQMPGWHEDCGEVGWAVTCLNLARRYPGR